MAVTINLFIQVLKRNHNPIIQGLCLCLWPLFYINKNKSTQSNAIRDFNIFDMSILTSGWLFDIYHLKDRIILWIKEKNGGIRRLEYLWSPSIYVASDLKSESIHLVRNNDISPLLKKYEFEYKYEYPSSSPSCSTNDHKKNRNEVLKLTVGDSLQIPNLARRIEKLSTRFGHYRLYNVDVSPEQAFLYENELHPLGLYNIRERLAALNDKWNSYRIFNDENDQIDSYDYLLPDFRFLSFDVISPERKTIALDFDDKISKIEIVLFDKDNNIKEKFSISEESELETILGFAYEINRLDPDIILTIGGDQFLFPHLFRRAKANEIENQLLVNLNRESNLEYLIKKNKWLRDLAVSTNDSSSTSYVSYGKVYFKPRPFFLYGRIHIDINNSFIYKDNGLDGLAELSRVCRIPLQLASRSTIGKCLSSLYFYNAHKKDVLIPWKPITSEIFKSFSDLLQADKGGFIFESKPGAYDKVAEFDFVSLYPNIMLKKNVSSDTINCECCDGELDNKVPELEHLYHLCKKRMGIVPLSLKTVLDRRLEYKKRKNIINPLSVNNEKLKDLYNNRQTALKWILVTSFGYLGFSNSKFGRIDAHIAVCAFARDILVKTSKIAERHGFEVIHGIVDSIWIRKKRNSTINDSNTRSNIKKDYENLKKDIEEQTGFSLSFEGVYKWIVFDSSKSNPELPALNRYFGVFEDGVIKMRGVETRRHDTPPFFVNFQEELMNTMSTFRNVKEIIEMLPLLESIYEKYKTLIISKKVAYPDSDLYEKIIKKQ